MTAKNRHKPTVSDVLDDWVTNVVQWETEITTRERYGCLIDLYLKPELGHVTAERLEVRHIYECQTTLRQLGKTQRTVDLTFTVLSGALSHAVKLGHIKNNVMASIRLRRGHSPEVIPPSKESVKRLLQVAEATSDPLFELIRLLVFTGLRRGEALGLTWGNVDLNAGTIQISSILVKTHHEGMVQKKPKTRKSSRKLSLDETTVKVLQQHRDSLGRKPKGSDLVFQTPKGQELKPSTIAYQLRRLVKNSGLGEELDGLNFHAFRHFHASVLLQSKQNPKAVADRLGHADVTTLLRIYAHLMPGWDTETVNAFTDAMDH